MNGALPPSSIAGLSILIGGLMQQFAADFGRAGEGDHAHARIVQHGADHLAGRRDGMTLTTPAGTPASSSAGISASIVSGVSDAGFNTTGQPAASAGPILRVAIAAGKFHGVTSTAMPAGLCCATMRAPEAGALEIWPILRTASSAYQRKNSAA